MSAQEKEAALREFNAARDELNSAKEKFKKAEAKFIEVTEGAFLARDSKKAPQEFRAGNTGTGRIVTDC